MASPMITNRALFPSERKKGQQGRWNDSDEEAYAGYELKNEIQNTTEDREIYAKGNEEHKVG